MANLLSTLITGNLRTTQGYGTSDSTRILYPGGGSFVTTTSVITGAIRIKMPVFGSGMMMTCTVKVYEYSSNKSFTITFGGHRDSDNWYAVFCYFDGDGNREDLTVRFGLDDGVNCVWIGETSNQWSYPQVFVTDVQMGFVGYSTSWLSGWSVGFVTSFGTINRTATAFQKITTTNIGSQSVNYAASAGNADTVDGYHESSFWRDHQNREIGILRFSGVGGNSGNSNQAYAIYQEGGAWSHPYPDLCIGYHTGIKIGAHFSYNGIRFYNNSDFATQTFSVNDGDNHVRVAYNLHIGSAGGWITDLLAAKQNASTAITTSNIGSQTVATAGALSSMNISQFTNNSGYITSSGSITGSAGSVAWSNITGRPNWMTSASLIASHSNANSQVNSGFYENGGGGGSNWPSQTWYNSINVRHSNQANYHGFQVAMSYYDNLLWFRSYQGHGTFQSWVYAISSANIGSQSVNYANYSGYSTGNAATATVLQTARTLTIGNTGKTFNGSANVSWTLAEIGAAAASHTHSYLPLSGGDLTGSIGVPSGSSVFLATSGDSNWRIGRNLVTESDNSLTGSTMQFIAANATDQGWQFVNSAGKTIVEISSYTNGGLFTINQKEFWLKQPIGGRLTTIRKKSTDTLSPNPVKIADTSLAAYSADGNPNTYIIIQTNVPQDEYQMGGFTVDLFGRYGDTNAKTKIDLGGYWNAEGNGGFLGWEAHGTNPQVKPTIQVARNTNSGMTAIIISGITWDHPVVVARDLYLGYNGNDGAGYGFGWHIYSAGNINSFTNLDTVVWRNAYSDSNPAGYITGYTETDTLATVTARGNTTNGAINVNGNILLTGTATTTNQGRMIDFTGFDKESTTDFSDRAYIQHTINDAGHTGSVLVISSQNDAPDGIGFLTNASSQIKHNSHVMWDAGNDGAGSGLDADLLDGLQLHTGTNNVANRVVRTQGNGYAMFGWINTISGNTTATISDVYVNTADGYIRKATGAHFISNLGLATSASLASASVNYANHSGYSNGLSRYGIIYGDNWNTYRINGQFIVMSAHGHSGSNRPSGAYTYGSGMSYYNAGSDHYQFFFPENGGSSNANSHKIWYRSGWNDNWGGWRSIVDLYNGACAIDGTVTASGDVIAYSDARVKENIHTIENALDKTLKLRGVTYNRTDVEDKSTKIGVIAQEIMEVLPEVVSEDETGMYGVSYGNLTAVLIEAIKEQQKQIEELRNELNKLKG